MNAIKQNLRQLLFNRQLLWITLFSIAMGMLESAVVIYLREIYYPQGFMFPLKPTSTNIAITELVREFATLVMLLSIAVLVGKSAIERFAWFLFCFAVWDIFYYIFLYVFIDWPASVFEWDVLFLLPTMWVGPVWAPVLLSITMIFLAMSILYNQKRKMPNTLNKKVLLLLISGSLIVIVSFCIDFYMYLINSFPNQSIDKLFFSENIFEYSLSYVPQTFYIEIFLLGFFMILAGIIIYLFQKRECVDQLLEINQQGNSKYLKCRIC
ncbi:MAG: hypothetical protein IPO21_17815 [Bacteroidales bacterium]|nr:hypothetical protein [Bacteroidales bacterium]